MLFSSVSPVRSGTASALCVIVSPSLGGLLACGSVGGTLVEGVGVLHSLSTSAYFCAHPWLSQNLFPIAAPVLTVLPAIRTLVWEALEASGPQAPWRCSVSTPAAERSCGCGWWSYAHVPTPAAQGFLWGVGTGRGHLSHLGMREGGESPASPCPTGLV